MENCIFCNLINENDPIKIPEQGKDYSIIKGMFIKGFKLRKSASAKVGCVFPMVVVSILPHAEFGPNDHREDAPHFTLWNHWWLATE